MLAPARRFFTTTAKEIDNNSPSVQSAVDDQKCENLVEERIKKLMTSNRDETQEEQLKPISNEDLEVRLSYFQVRVCALHHKRTSRSDTKNCSPDLIALFMSLVTIGFAESF